MNSRNQRIRHRIERRLRWQHALHDHDLDPRNRLPVLGGLRRFQHRRLALSFAEFLDDPKTQPAATFFLRDLYGDKDFSGRDADVAKVVPIMARLMPASLVETLGQAIELGALTHAFDLRMAQHLEAAGVGPEDIDTAAYAEAYRACGCPRTRQRQIDLILEVGEALDRAVHTPGVARLLRLSRLPARAAGVLELQAFLERGFDAFKALGDAQRFLDAIESQERTAAARMFAGTEDPFGLGDQLNSRSR